MNRGRRRGGPGLTGLRDGVKRRLFDPHLVPTKPDEKNEINRLLPAVFSCPAVHSRLNSLRKSKDGEVVEPADSSFNPPDKLRNNLVHSKAVFELAFRKGPFYHPLVESSEGIDIGRVYGTSSSTEGTEKSTEPVLLAHLILAHHDLNLWCRETQFVDLADPETWYPKELVQFTKPGRKSVARQRARQKSAKKPAVNPVVNDLEVFVLDQLIQQTVEVSEVGDQEKPDAEPDVQDNESGDSDDARWNGEVVAEGDPDDLDEEELDNDYCQTYFDNGEGDLSDTGLGGVDDDDDGGSKFYE